MVGGRRTVGGGGWWHNKMVSCTFSVPDTSSSSSLYCASLMLGLKGRPCTVASVMVVVVVGMW